jgi:hypothetical protein
MIIGPSPYFGVEPTDQIGGGHAQRSLDISADTIQKGLDILFGRLDEQFPIGILAHILSEKIKAFLHDSSSSGSVWEEVNTDIESQP